MDYAETLRNFIGAAQPANQGLAGPLDAMLPRPDPRKPRIATPADYDFWAYHDPTAHVGISFMRGGVMPRIGELSAAPSANIIDRTGRTPEEATDPKYIQEWLPSDNAEFNNEQKDNENSQMAKALGISNMRRTRNLR